MDKLRIREAIAVEGRYDAHTVRACFDTAVIELNGFGIYKNAPLRAQLSKYASSCGLIVLTDSDSAGFMIRSRVSKCVPPGTVKHAYIPDIAGKEKRKKRPSAEGTLGVEGMSREVIVNAVLSAGATLDSAEPRSSLTPVTRVMLYDDGFFGGADSAALRRKLTDRLGLPAKLSVSALVDALNRLCGAEKYAILVNEIKKETEEQK